MLKETISLEFISGILRHSQEEPWRIGYDGWSQHALRVYDLHTHTKKNARETRPRAKVLTITRRIGEWRIWWNTYNDGWRGTGWKNSLELFEKTRRRKDIGALQREMTNHHRINLKPLHRPTYTANKVSGEITVKQFWKGGAHWPSLPKVWML